MIPELKNKKIHPQTDNNILLVHVVLLMLQSNTELQVTELRQCIKLSKFFPRGQPASPNSSVSIITSFSEDTAADDINVLIFKNLVIIFK